MFQMEEVLKELIGGGKMLTDARHGTQAIEIITAAYVSHVNGNVPVTLPLKEEDTKVYLPIT